VQTSGAGLTLFAVSAAHGPRPPREGRPHLVSDNPSPRRKLFRGVWSPWLAVLGLALHFLLRQLFDPWLNSPSDTKLGTAVFILGLPLVFSAYALFRAIVGPPRPDTKPKTSPPNPKESPWH
jgi:hypothetical protein